jgi:formylglycine-generating enzyme required for sulfatase activity
VAAFHLDKYEATVGRFRAWVKAGMPTPKRGTILQRDLDGNSVRWGASAETAVQRGDRIVGWKRYDTYAALMFTSPKNNVNFYTAQAFCHWDGGRLPTEHEWKYVAVGGEENRRHPWGNQRPTFEHAVYNCGGDGNPSCGVQDLITVGSKPLGSGRWGHMDLAGSVFEWAVAHEGSSRPDGRTAKSRGGGFCYIGGDDHRAALGLQATTARADELSVISHTVGVRCAYDAK